MGAAQFRLEVGTSYGTQLLGETYTIVVRRGVKPTGVTDDLDPATFTAVIRGGETVNPETNDDVRPERPVRLRASLDSGDTWSTLWTGKMSRARIEYVKDDATDPSAYRLHLTGTDVVSALAPFPSEVAIDGNMLQQVAAVMDPTGLPYTVDDPSGSRPASPLPTDARDVLGQLRLIRDTGHGLMYINRDGELAVIADNARPRVPSDPEWTATDDSTVNGIHYTQLGPALDTDALVNVLTIKYLNGADNPESVWTDEDSRDAWGAHAQAITVNAGVVETHADLWLASRVDPTLVPEQLEFTAQERVPVSRPPEGRDADLTAAVGIELYDTIRVVRAGIPTADLLVREISHLITPLQWTVELGLRVPEVLATRWCDVPEDLTWADLPADMTWREAVHWRPYEGV